MAGGEISALILRRLTEDAGRPLGGKVIVPAVAIDDDQAKLARRPQPIVEMPDRCRVQVRHCSRMPVASEASAAVDRAHTNVRRTADRIQDLLGDKTP